MFLLIEMEDVVRVPPEQFGRPLEQVAIDALKAKYESMITPEFGFAILVKDVKVDPTGKIVLGDGASYHKVSFTLLTFYPKIQEIVEGEVVEITDFGAFVRIGPTDALLHLSQIIDDYLTSDVRQGMIIASETKRALKIGTRVRVRITAISLGRGATLGKIGVTCRQPFLGAIEWIEEDLKKVKEVEKKQEAKVKKK